MSTQEALMQIGLMIVLVALSAFFSATETAFSSLNRARLKSLAEHGKKRAADALALEDRYDELLSTILVGNNIVNIALASVGTVVFVSWIGNAGVSVSTAVITVVVLIFGEISPKSLAKEAPERFAMAVCPVVRGLMTVLKPVNWLFSKWKLLLRRMFSVQDEPSLTQDELLTLVEEAEQEGGMNADESELLKSAIEFHDLDVSDILTPRVRVEGVPLESAPKEAADRFEESGYSRLPVYEETLDHIVGVIHQKDFYNRVRKGGDFGMAQIMKKPVYVTPSAKISDTLRLLQRTQSQMAVVADEYGGTVGIVTMEDILEELVGEIWDEHDEVEEPFRFINDATCRALGSADPEELFEQLNIDAQTEASTVGGWVMEMTESVPKPGDSFDCSGWHAVVLKTDGRHVQEIELRKATVSA
ncbi:MAG: hemolysin family protein [Clostridiales bacterium]|nr:hemolysin family protein [Clostridiales bacterium]